jgi:hypothetical protein
MNNKENIFIFIGLGFLGMVVALYCSPQLERFRYGSSADRFISYSKLDDIEESLKRKNFFKADTETANLVFKIVGKEKIRRIGRLDVPNLSCQYLLELDDIWTRKSNGKFGFTAQSELLRKSEIKEDTDASEKKFQVAVGWNTINNNIQEGHFPHEIYKQDFVVPTFSKRLRECVKDRG